MPDNREYGSLIRFFHESRKTIAGTRLKLITNSIELAQFNYSDPVSVSFF
jgi:hypothetical protein